jgi:hypothetical protein
MNETALNAALGRLYTETLLQLLQERGVFSKEEINGATSKAVRRLIEDAKTEEDRRLWVLVQEWLRLTDRYDNGEH